MFMYFPPGMAASGSHSRSLLNLLMHFFPGTEPFVLSEGHSQQLNTTDPLLLVMKQKKILLPIASK